MFSALAFGCSVCVGSLGLFAWLLLFVGCVVGGSFSLRMIATKRKGAPLLVLPLCSWVVGLLYAHKLIQIIPGFVGSKISPSGCGVLYFAGSLSYFTEVAIFHGFACFIYFDFDAAPITY